MTDQEWMSPALEDMKKRNALKELGIDKVITETLEKRNAFLGRCVFQQTILRLNLRNDSALVGLYDSHDEKSVTVCKDGGTYKIPFLNIEGIDKL